MTSLESVIKGFNKTFGEELVSVGLVRKDIKKIPFSSPRLNYMTYGGLPRNMMVEFFGAEWSGKTTTALDIAGQAQKLFVKEHKEELKHLSGLKKPTSAESLRLTELKTKGAKKVLYVDHEHTLDQTWAETLGVDTSSLVIAQPMNQSAEQVFQFILEAIDSGEIGLCVLDSLAVMVSGQELEKTIEENTVAGISKALTKFSKKMASACAKHECLFIGINQLRDNIGNTYVPTTTTGGRAWRHHCAIRLQFRQGKVFDDSGKAQSSKFTSPFGNKIEVSIAKIKTAPPNRKNGEQTLRYESGIDFYQDCVTMAIEVGLIAKSGAWYTLLTNTTDGEPYEFNGDIVKAQGEGQMTNLLKDNESLFKFVQSSLEPFING